MEGDGSNWSESVEDLVHGGELDKAISLLESAVSKLEAPNSSQSDSFQLSSALCDLAKLYSTKGLSLKADEARSRALILRARCHQTPPRLRDLEIAKDLSEKLGSPLEASASDVPLDDNGHQEKSVLLPHNASPPEECPDNGAYFCEGHPGKPSELYHNSSPHEGFAEDDWEAIADRAPEELLSPPCIPEVSKLSLEDTKTPIPKRRGKGTFSYMTRGLYSEQQFYGSAVHCSEDEGGCQSSEVDAQARNSLEACKHIQCPFTLRVLDENDTLLKLIPPRDLEPPQQRPETSTRTARRLIAQGMGIKLPSTNFGSRELRKQEEARRNRIVSRRNLKDDAWGDDVN